MMRDSDRIVLIKKTLKELDENIRAISNGEISDSVSVEATVDVANCYAIGRIRGLVQ